jgi:SAM-dependent methyltransferase
MSDLGPHVIDAHNRQQREYFERTTKSTMVPRRSAYLSRQVSEVMRHVPLAPGERVLEVGCGMGRYTLPLAAQGCAVEGLDLAPALLDRLRAFNAGRFHIPLYAADIIDYPPALEGQFAAVIGFFTLHHVHALDACYAAMARLVRPGGRIVFLEPNPYNPTYYLQILVTPTTTWRGERGILNMRRRCVFDAMQAAGLVEPAVESFGLFPPVLADRRWAQPIERAAEALLAWTPCLAFQIFSARRPA